MSQDQKNLSENPGDKIEREVYVISRIDQERMTQAIMNILRHYYANPTEPITVIISSAGGELDPAIAFYEIMKMKRISLVTQACVSVDSAAIAVLCAGAKRYATASSLFVFHPLYRLITNKELTAADMDIWSKDMKHTSNIYRDIIAKTTGRKASEIANWITGKRILNAKEALEAGLIHEIIELPEVVLSSPT